MKYIKFIIFGIVGCLIMLMYIINSISLAGKLPIEAQCNVKGNGQTSCLFYNKSYLPASGCAEIEFIQTQSSNPLISQKLCSGFIWPRQNFSIETGAAFLNSPIEYCLSGYDRKIVFSSGKNWYDYCSMNV